MKQLYFGNFPPLDYACNEALNTLCTNLSFVGKNIRKIMLTSCHSDEGKSFISLNMMRTMAKIGYSVALVDTDLRRSHIVSKYKLTDVEGKPLNGIAHFLSGKIEDPEEIIYETDLEGGYFVPIGRKMSNPLPLFNSELLPQFLDFLESKFDYVIIDTAPVGTVIDAAQIAQHCDGALIVVNYNAVHRQELIDTKQLIEQTGCPILGTVLNQVEMGDYSTKKYYYRSSYYRSYYGYSDDSKSKKKK